MSERGYVRADVERLYNPIQQHGVKAITPEMDAVNTEEVKVFGDVCQKISVQTTGDLVVDIEVSVNGTDWVDTTLDGTSAAIVSYETHNVAAVRFTRTAGTGRVHLLGAI